MRVWENKPAYVLAVAVVAVGLMTARNSAQAQPRAIPDVQWPSMRHRKDKRR